MVHGDGARYLPILKSRQGELKALEAMESPIGDDFTPIVELVEVDLDGLNGVEVGERLDKLAAKVARAWPAGRPRVVVDTFGIEVDTEVTSWGLHGEAVPLDPITARLLERLRDAGLRAVPVIRLSDQRAYIDSLTGLVGDQPEPGACLRIGGEDLDDTMVPLDQAVERLLAEYELDPDDVDLVLDFGALTDDNTLAMASRLARFVLPSLDRAAWRSFSLGSGAFPVNLAEVSAFSIAEIPRRDRQLWVQLSSLRLRQQLDYTDYAVTHPLLQTGVAFAAPPQIRYTAGGHWLVMKGRRTDRRGHKQIFDLCGRLLRDRPSEVAPPFQSWGDVWIHDAAKNAGVEDTVMGPGNASTWRAIATSHHIGHVLHSLSTRNEP